MNTRQAALACLAFVPLFLAGPIIQDALADRGGRGGRGGGGGGRGGMERNISRSGPAASGSFSSRPSGARQASGFDRSRAAATTSRQAGSVERSGQRAQTRQSGQGERTERTEIRQGERTERQGQRQEGMTERTESRTDAARDIADDWDDHHHHDGDNWGYAAAGAIVGGAIGYAAGAATSSSTYVYNLPCSPSVVTASTGTYYGCSGTWYNRSYVDGSVVYITVNPPPGY